MESPEPNDDDQNAECQEQTYFEEAAEIDAIVQRVVDSEGKDVPQMYDRYKAILTKYQEQSQLLDEHLEGIVVPLANLMRRQAVLQREQGLQSVLSTCRLLNLLVVVRGYKTVVRFFPHEAADLERVVDILDAVRAQQPKDAEEGLVAWEAQTMLLLWLSILILIPFDLATVDSTAINGRTEGVPYTALVARILDMCKDYLHRPGGVREMAAVVLGRLLTRPDMAGAFSEFLDWCPQALAAVDPLRAPFLLPGVMQALCRAFKLGQRDRLLPFASRAWALAARLAASGTGGGGGAGGDAGAGDLSGNVLARKLSVKLITRVGLTFLPPREASWRYVRGGASLDDTLAPGGPGAAAAAPAPASAADEEGEEDEIQIVEEVEEVVEALLGALRDRDTVVRWSGAKGVGRVAGCLPRELGDEVVAGVLGLFGPTESDAAWHGGCLALAELARRGLLLPERLPAIIPLVREALHYDVRRGPHSIGAHVRDAAAYVCWAFARAYEPQLLEGSVTLLASSLLTIACYDREVNCRRAASAAFQECVGRLGNFPHGIPLCTIADYFAVGIAQQAYLKVAPQVAAAGPEYRTALARHLVGTKARHWEKALRELAARGAAALAPHVGGFLSTTAMDELLPACLDEQLEVRHGAVVMVAELLPALAATGGHAADTGPRSSAGPEGTAAEAGPAGPGPSSPQGPASCWPLSPERAERVAELVPAIDRARLYRGKGGQVMREAVSLLVRGCAGVRLALSGPQHAKVLEALDENLRIPQPYIQEGAVAALGAYARAYLATDARAAAAFRTRYADAYLARLHDPNVAVRRGYAAALGCLPPQLLAPMLDEAVDALVDGCVPEEDPDERDVESRVACTKALGSLLATMLGPEAEAAGLRPGPEEAGTILREKVLPSLAASLEDYTTDNRGDVGSWVREAAMGATEVALPLLAGCSSEEEEAGELRATVGRFVGLLLRQSVERISRVRETALRHVLALASSAPMQPYVPAVGAVRAAAEAGSAAADAGGVSASLEALTCVVVRLFAVQPYTAPLLEGLVASVGGVDASLSKVASAALTEALAAAAAADGGADGAVGASVQDAPLLHAVCGDLLDIWARNPKSARLATPLLRTALLLLTKVPAAAEVRLTRPPPAQAVAAASGSGDASPAESGSGSGDGAGSRFVDHLVEAVRAETRGVADVARLLDAAVVLCHLVPYDTGHCRTSALQGLMVLLASRFPKVRRHSAEQLYLQLLALDDTTPTTSSTSAAPSSTPTSAPAPPLEAVAEAACDVLLGTCWDGDLDPAKAARDQLAALVGVTVPKMKAPAGAGPGGPGGAKGQVRDENASYQALLDDFARGY
ncbi:hypothetical protein HYH03_009582 [Edaphochlamys debaryana]|uniref:Tubulin-specific chaperone D n=1 Tax=Edaphochlamys debaryana TaxID=47281 RepID=A0A836BWV8_9CHLO|nr:hypothetical protein HYH03_009582 [Edaphochlamys debaryana]|eukprot:KAG2492086.1 hypothetical protein HYH03_009582 [Edaphochlamys debaryana]